MPRSSAVQALATLDRITEATRKLLTAGGYDDLSMRAVAAEAGITPGAIYRHFPGKSALVDHVVRATFEDFHLRLLEAIAPHPPGSFRRVVALGETYIRVALEQPQHFKILFTHLKPTPTRLGDLPGEGGFRILRQCLAEAIETGQVRRCDPDVAAFYLWSRVHGIVMLLMTCDFSESLPLPPGEITAPRLFDLTRELLWTGFRPDDPVPPPAARKEATT